MIIIGSLVLAVIVVVLLVYLRPRRQSPTQDSVVPLEAKPASKSEAPISPIAKESLADTAPNTPATAIDESFDAILKQAALARTGGDHAAAKQLYLDVLSRAITGNNRDVQADARLAMGDMARDADDMTTACEHWQLSRDLYAQCDRANNVREVEERMRSHQCPTDWVLTDF